jgi:formamidopyrimidine-DNA glycosylase
MPELPEIETIRRGLSESVLHKPILKVDVNNASVLRTEEKRFDHALRGHSFGEVNRRGKMMIFPLVAKGGKRTGEYLIARLGMTGRLVSFGAEDALWGSESYKQKDSYSYKHCHVAIRFADKSLLLYCDSRRFGYMEILDEEGLRKKLAKFGPEPLEKGFTLRTLVRIMEGRKTGIKAFLLNQSCIAGIGNIYADEILFDAGIMPTRKVVSLTLAEKAALYKSMRRILRKAVEKRGTSFSDYVDATGKEGSYQKSLRIYGRAGEPCLGCKGKVQRMVVAGRGTNYCSVCQK